MGRRTIEILPDKPAIVARSQQLVVDRMQTAIAQNGRCTIALAGGSTPKPLYASLVEADIDWSKVHVFWGDERYVQPDHPDSNEGMARQAWLNHINIPADNIHPMPTNEAKPAMAATAHETAIYDVFQLAPGEVPAFDIILLGMGDDGHTASLFPQTEALAVCDRLVTVGNKQGEPRLTFTLPVLNNAQCIIFLVAGANKQDALQQVLAPASEPVDANMYPARYVDAAGETWWLIDQAADGGHQFDQR